VGGQIVQGKTTGNKKDAGPQLFYFFGFARVVLVLDFAHDLLKDVLQGDEARSAAVLVQGDGHVLALTAKFQKHLFEIERFGDEKRGAHDGPGVGMLAAFPHEMGQEILGVNHAEDVVPVALIDGNAGMAVDAHEFADGSDAVIGLGTNDVGSGNHDVGHLLFFQAQDVEQHGGIFLDQGAVLVGLQDELFDGNAFLPEKFA